ncbi:unnamed protein product [Dibothriocephalus latus]|uniref:EF-hand domain-containing protein n=1 Tax=Dibothriocephalus latus TaxID=60516 RepID=A0A3P7NZN6_DIBLA|nr:unnamed protein product [Dibothriocephalus latus]
MREISPIRAEVQITPLCDLIVGRNRRLSVQLGEWTGIRSQRIKGNVFDHNNDSVIDPDEIKRTMHFLGESVTDEEVQAMLLEADTDQDGLVNFEGTSLSFLFIRGVIFAAFYRCILLRRVLCKITQFAR